MTGNDSTAFGSQNKLYKTKTESKILSRQPDRLFSCLQCDFTNKKKGKVLLHMQSIHEGEVYCCDRCDYQAKTPSNLKQHLSSIHDGVQYSCVICDY